MTVQLMIVRLIHMPMWFAMDEHDDRWCLPGFSTAIFWRFPLWITRRSKDTMAGHASTGHGEVECLLLSGNSVWITCRTS